MTIAGSTTWLAIAGLDPGGIIGVLLLLVAVTFTAFMTRRGGQQCRRPAGTPIYRRGVVPPVPPARRRRPGRLERLR